MSKFNGNDDDHGSQYISSHDRNRGVFGRHIWQQSKEAEEDVWWEEEEEIATLPDLDVVEEDTEDLKYL